MKDLLLYFNILLILTTSLCILIPQDRKNADLEDLNLFHPDVQTRAKNMKISIENLGSNHYKLTAHCEGKATPLDLYAALHEMYHFAHKIGYLNASLESDLRLSCPIELRFFVFCEGKAQ